MGIQPENSETEWNAINGLEGFSLNGLVPKRNDGTVAGHSGVTIAHGFDLGQQTNNTLEKLTAYGLTKALKTKLEPYTGKCGRAASVFLEKKPLRLTAGEGKILDAAVKQMETARVIKFYDQQVAKNPDPHSIQYHHFSDLPGNAKTVVASIYYQRGGNAARFHTLLQDIQKGDFAAAAKEMREDIIPQSKYPGRREAEAKLLDGPAVTQQPHKAALGGKKVKFVADTAAPAHKAGLKGGRSCDTPQGCDRNGVPLPPSYATAPPKDMILHPHQRNPNLVVVNLPSL